MIITDRDRKIINYIDKVGFATSKNLAELFFKNGSKNYYIVALNRLNQLMNEGRINMTPARISNNGRPMNLYYAGNKPSNKSLKHALALADFSAELTKNDVDILSLEREYYASKSVRADGLYKVIYNNKKRLFLVEFDITKKFTITKYEYLYSSGEWKDNFKKFPRIVSISDEKSPEGSRLNIIRLNSNLDNINKLLENLK